MTKILALAGRKQSGKNTAFNFLLGISLLKLAVVREKIEIREQDGRLWVSDILGDEEHSGIVKFGEYSDSPQIQAFNDEFVYPFIRNYSFADTLKQSVCIDLLGLKWEQCYGTDEQKNSFTELKWEDMPGVTTNKTPQDKVDKVVAGRLGEYYEKIVGDMIYHQPGNMTGREVMQFVGTEIFRKMHNEVWSGSTVRKILKDESRFAVITDCRFPNEVKAVQEAGGKVIRLTRNPFPDDKHDSETALDQENYDWDNFDAVIDNEDMSISDQNGTLYKQLENWGWFSGVNMPEVTSA